MVGIDKEEISREVISRVHVDARDTDEGEKILFRARSKTFAGKWPTGGLQYVNLVKVTGTESTVISFNLP
jgi:hypothetical protein